ncbi:hypothetical protein T552_03221 [Pneumocystis carinii B80]|uniref:AAA+ ATPase domain-containing protein n=1 Tax=Pneumocystis carinii (strain B80) TaxID=1408658 RepID=A0A0W4ZC23_PNEC8|nr:hypothetical protein T552_03221 [Pneumocystis carinii B80]KTW25947.1 hypothetical protein T552_03221 [Pneumocystis carinii B80]
MSGGIQVFLVSKCFKRGFGNLIVGAIGGGKKRVYSERVFEGLRGVLFECNKGKIFVLIDSRRYTREIQQFRKIKQVKTCLSGNPGVRKIYTNEASIFGQRYYRTSSQSYNCYLADLEEKANASMNDPKQQYLYYKSLLNSYPEFIISRYEDTGAARNKDCDLIYAKALESTGQMEKAMLVRKHINSDLGNTYSDNSTQKSENTHANTQENPSGSNANNNQLLSNYSNMSMVQSFSQNTKKNPIYVVTEESRQTKIFKWARFILSFTFVGYLIVLLSTIFAESAGVLRSLNKSQDIEASGDNLPDVKFSDICGVDEAKEDLQEVVDFLKNPEKFTALGGKLPKGVLLIGPPGTGKTMLAKAVAKEAGVSFFFMSGSEFDEMYVGIGAKRVRELFNIAKNRSPSIVFIDELDAIGSKRNPKDSAYIKQTLNQLLVELDGFSNKEGIIIMAATNFPESLDPALIRPGRFDKHVIVPLPDIRGRLSILKQHTKKIRMANDIDLTVLARGTPGFSGADLQNLVNQAAIKSSKLNSTYVSMKDLEWARDKILMGTERKNAFITEESKRNTAYHEGGHALVALYTPGAMKLHKATIIPRGSSLGMVMQLPDMDKYTESKKEFLAKIDVALGGRVAEELTLGKDNITSGSLSDIQNATAIAKAMVTQYGMSDKVGPVAYDQDLSRLSSSTKALVESEIKTLLEEAQARATNILKTHKKELDRLAKALIEFETLTSDEIEKAIRGEKIDHLD